MYLYHAYVTTMKMFFLCGPKQVFACGAPARLLERVCENLVLYAGAYVDRMQKSDFRMRVLLSTARENKNLEKIKIAKKIETLVVAAARRCRCRRHSSSSLSSFLQLVVTVGSA